MLTSDSRRLPCLAGKLRSTATTTPLITLTGTASAIRKLTSLVHSQTAGYLKVATTVPMTITRTRPTPTKRG
jgi:hypothetical protein